VSAPIAVGRVLGVPVASQLRALARPALATGALLAAGFAIGDRFEVGAWPLLFGGVAVTFPVALAVAAVLGLDRAQRGRLVVRLRALVQQSRRTP